MKSIYTLILLMSFCSIGFSYNTVQLTCSRTYEEVIDSGYIHSSEDMKEFTEHCNKDLGGHRVNPGKCATGTGHVWCVKQAKADSSGFGQGTNCNEAAKNARLDCKSTLPEADCSSVWRTNTINYTYPYCN